MGASLAFGGSNPPHAVRWAPRGHMHRNGLRCFGAQYHDKPALADARPLILSLSTSIKPNRQLIADMGPVNLAAPMLDPLH